MLRFVLAALMLSACITSIAAPKIKIIGIIVNTRGEAYIGRDTLQLSDLAAEVQERLWKSYLGTDKMYDSIKIEFIDGVLAGTREAALDAIRLAQKNALTEICLQKYKRLFENCSSGQQRKIQKQFPVLFQELH